MTEPITVRRDLEAVDWNRLKADLGADDFDNGRTADELRLSFERSFATALVWRGEQVVGKARLLGDGICNAYLVDVWTSSVHRRQGIGGAMVRDLLERVAGCHVVLFTESHAAFYEGLGFVQDPDVGMSTVVGRWLNRPPV